MKSCASTAAAAAAVAAAPVLLWYAVHVHETLSVTDERFTGRMLTNKTVGRRSESRKSTLAASRELLIIVIALTSEKERTARHTDGRTAGRCFTLSRTADVASVTVNERRRYCREIVKLCWNRNV